MRVAILTSWGERCGIAEYAANLIKYCPEVEFEIIDCRCSNSNMRYQETCERSDIFVMNYEPGLYPSVNGNEGFVGKPSVLILHTSCEGTNESKITNSFSRVVVHEKTQDTNPKFRYIPMGIVPSANEFYRSKAFDLGTCGFPFNWKGFTEVVTAGKILGRKTLVIIPESHHADVEIMANHLRLIDPIVTIVTDWLDQDQVITKLASCRMTAFPYHGSPLGISGAVRLGLATGNPILLSRCRQFRDLFEYEDEIEFVGQPHTGFSVAEGIVCLVKNGKKPKRVLEDMSWKKVGQTYYELFQELIG